MQERQSNLLSRELRSDIVNYMENEQSKQGSFAAATLTNTYAGAGTEQELKRYLPHLGKMSLQLRQTAKQIEDSVVEVCGSFQGIAERAKTTVSKSTEFLIQDSSKGGSKSFESLLETCSDTMVRIMAFSAETGELARQAIERIEQMEKASLAISGSLLKLEHIATGNKILALNARIEAAHSGAMGAGFAAVAVELSAQTLKSQEVTAEVGDLAASLRSFAALTLEDLRRMSTRDKERSEQCRRDVEESMDELHSAHQDMKATLSSMTSDGALLASDISRAVRGMQFQDRTNQRITHVVEDLDSLQTKLEQHLGTVCNDVAAADEDFSAYTMREERQAAGLLEIEADAGDVELF